MTRIRALFAICTGLAVTACAQLQELPINTANLTTSSTGTTETTPPAAARGTPVVVGKPSRLYVMVGFKEKDCAPVEPQISVTTPPGKGTVTLKPGEQAAVQFSTSGKCTGKVLPGTGIYYSANKGATGTDTFTVTASTGPGQSAVRSFNVRVVQ